MRVYHMGMTRVLVEKNPHIDESDMRFLLEILSAKGYEAESVDQKTVLKSVWWVATFHWVADDTSHLAFDAALTAAAVKIRRHFVSKKKSPPQRLDIKDRDGHVIGSIEIAESEAGGAD